ncbi:MAG: PA0069 family radical SAM protein [Verrucomicrobiae bacterium]|nr:PA0069 family radical SAM protein [Verrucomicrobiae bacterium]
MPTGSKPLRGRGAAINPTGRFDELHYEPDPDATPDESPAPRTRFYRDHSCSIISYNDSPDIGFAASLNPYRGCEHGCAYCYARPYHEYLGLSAGLDFETKILVKENAPELLRRELQSPHWQPQPLALSGVTDPYQPIERHLQLTRRCLAVLAECRNPVCIVTKNHLVRRDLDLLTELARHHAACVYLSLTTLDDQLVARMEPRTARPAARLRAIHDLAQAGIPVGVLVSPVIPGLTDHEIPSLLKAAADAGAQFAHMTVLRLPGAVQQIFLEWLTREFPARRERVLQQIRALRNGQLNDSQFGTRLTGTGPAAERLHTWFDTARRRAGLAEEPPPLNTSAFRRPTGPQLTLFD